MNRFKSLPFLSLFILGLVQCLLVFMILTSIYGTMQVQIARTQGLEITPLEGARLVIERGWDIAQEAWGRLVEGDLPGLFQSLKGLFGAAPAETGTADRAAITPVKANDPSRIGV
jgi:hypothetical protein